MPFRYRMSRLAHNPWAVGVVFALVVGIVVALAVVSHGRQRNTSSAPAPTGSNVASSHPAATEPPLPVVSPEKAPDGLMGAVTTFEEGLRTLKLTDTAATRRARVSKLADPEYLAKLDFALCDCPADQARIKGHITITAKLLPENITIDEDHGVYFVTALVDILQTSPQGNVLQQYQLPLHSTVWHKSPTGWQALDGDSDSG